MNTLIINAGSSSLKFKIFNENYTEIASGLVEKIGLPGSFFDWKINKTKGKLKSVVNDHQSAINLILKFLQQKNFDLSAINKVGHRVVHGAEEFVEPTLLTNEIIKKIAKYNKLAPLHNPNNLSGVRACLKLFPKAKNYAVFDTAFHSTLPEYAYLYPLPLSIYKKYAVRRYGFHGISHQYVSLKAIKELKNKNANLIVCHLGSGCSISAVKKGKSIDTSMGFTPLEGLMMSSRSGDIDPAIVLYLQTQGMTPAEIDELLNKKSGLKGVSGLKDMREIMIGCGYKIKSYNSTVKWTAKKKKLAQLALQMFVYRVRKYIGAYSLILGKVDAIIFTAGIGERNADVRNLIMKNIKTKSLVVPTNEELMIAKLI